MKVELHPCYILHQKPYRETSLILDVFSLDHGRVNLVAKGAKRKKNGQSYILQPARKLNLAWSARSEMGTLIAAEELAPSPKLNNRWLLSVFYINELLIRMLHKHEPHAELFNIYDLTLHSLDKKVNEEETLRVFEKHLLQALGYGLVLDHEPNTGEKVKSDGHYYYLLNHGPESSQFEASEYMQISGKALLALENEEFRGEVIAKEVKGLLRFILKQYIGDRPLESRALYKAYINNIK